MKLRKFARHALSLLIVVFFLLPVLGNVDLPLLNRLENISYDQRLRFTMPGGIDERIVIVDLDEKSLDAVGQWPWPRDVVASMVDSLFNHYEIGVLGFDVVFAESDDSSGLRVLDQLAQGPLANNDEYKAKLEELRPQLILDNVFGKTLEDLPVVMGFFNSSSVQEGNVAKKGMLPAPAMPLEQLDGMNLPLFKPEGYVGNLEVLQGNALSGGFFDNPQVDEDGVFRRLPLLVQHETGIYEALSLAVVRLIAGMPELELVVADGYEGADVNMGLEKIKADDFVIPVGPRSTVLVPYRGRQGSFPYVSAVDIINRTAPKDVMEGTIVLVGTTAAGLLDLRSTPVQNIYAGVEVHANLVAGILDGNIKERPHYVLAIELIQVALLGLLVTFLMPRLSPIWGTLMVASLAGAVVWLNLYAWTEANMVINLAVPLVLLGALFLFQMSYGFFVEARGKRQLGKLFGQYIPPELVDEMNESPQEFGLKGESRDMTVLFSDVRGFTTISEGLDPEELTQLMNELLTPMTGIIHEYRGTIDKYMGDAIMAFWGAPLRDENHAKNAMLAGLAMIEKIEENAEYYASKGWPPIRMGVGLNTGPMNVGNMGSEFRMAYTVLGDAVNLGSRLEGLTKQYGVDIMVSEYTKAEVPDFFYRKLDVVRVKGKDEPVTIFEPLGEKVDEETGNNLDTYHQALDLYTQQQWDEADALLVGLQERDPGRMVYDIYRERIAHFKEESPGEDWDGVFTHTTK